MDNRITINYTDEEVPVLAQLKDSHINIQLDGGMLRTSLQLEINSAMELADQIRYAAGEKTFEILEDEILSKDAKIEELQDIIEQYEENNDAYREKMTLSSGPF